MTAKEEMTQLLREILAELKAIRTDLDRSIETERPQKEKALEPVTKETQTTQPTTQ